jgi:hypothetical protein
MGQVKNLTESGDTIVLLTHPKIATDIKGALDIAVREDEMTSPWFRLVDARNKASLLSKRPSSRERHTAQLRQICPINRGLSALLDNHHVNEWCEILVIVTHQIAQTLGRSCDTKRSPCANTIVVSSKADLPWARILPATPGDTSG